MCTDNHNNEWDEETNSQIKIDKLTVCAIIHKSETWKYHECSIPSLKRCGASGDAIYKEEKKSWKESSFLFSSYVSLQEC